MGQVETELEDPAASTALAMEVASLLEKEAVTVAAPRPRVMPRVLLPHIFGSQKVRGD